LTGAHQARNVALQKCHTEGQGACIACAQLGGKPRQDGAESAKTYTTKIAIDSAKQCLSLLAFARDLCTHYRPDKQPQSDNITREKYTPFHMKKDRKQSAHRGSIFAAALVLCACGFLKPVAAQNGTDREARERVTQEGRLQILREERADIRKRLAEATDALPSAKDKDAAAKTVSRLEGDLKAIEGEIARVANRPAPVAELATKPATDGGKSEGEKPKAAKPWDVFNNF